ncbi:MAG: thiamine phosphate synthase [Methanocorpusculum sp.]|jgi:thiamine-phosphate pyrophosphorylase|nr:thiamine phosphate synthase [Methanocorpusculum sp.]MBR5450848.1 thiamine phosphate synthase [Methanocorpusculum sp.]
MRYDLYVVTDEGLSRGKTHVEIAREAVAGGADVIQLRDKTMESASLYAAALEIAEICKGKALFFVNDRLDIALAAGADGVHVGQSDLPADVVRKLVPKDFLVGVSVGSVEEAEKAVRDGADYVAVSPVFSTASKSDAGVGHGLDTAHAICDAVSVPVVGIGGLNKENIPEVIKAGIDGIAVISAVVSQEDISASAAELSAIIAEAKRSV